jgi:hypothetical protein
MYVTLSNFKGFGLFGMTSPIPGWTSSQIINAAAANNAKYVAGKLLLTRTIDSNTRFGFDPTQPQYVYILDPYWGAGPDSYNPDSADLGRFISYIETDGSYRVSWPGAISHDDWLKTLPPAQAAAMSAAFPPMTTPSTPSSTIIPSSTPVNPMIQSTIQPDYTTYAYAGLGLFAFIALLLFLKRRRQATV